VGGRKLSQAPFTKLLMEVLRVNHFPKVPSFTVTTLGIRCQHRNFWGDKSAKTLAIDKKNQE
jgi:hypothetical protein